MNDYSLLNACIEYDVLRLEKIISYSLWCDYYNGRIGKDIYRNAVPFEQAMYLRENIDDDLYKFAKRYNHNRYCRIIRLKERIASYIEHEQCVFLTLEFKDEVFERTSEETRRQYVRRFLCSQEVEFVANIDYGEKKGREHYHAVCTNRIDLKAWPYGFIYARVVNRPNSEVKLAKYITKLVHHAIKLTTKNCYCIYSNKKKRKVVC